MENSKLPAAFQVLVVAPLALGSIPQLRGCFCSYPPSSNSKLSFSSGPLGSDLYLRIHCRLQLPSSALSNVLCSHGCSLYFFGIQRTYSSFSFLIFLPLLPSFFFHSANSHAHLFQVISVPRELTRHQQFSNRAISSRGRWAVSQVSDPIAKHERVPRETHRVPECFCRDLSVKDLGAAKSEHIV